MRDDGREACQDERGERPAVREVEAGELAAQVGVALGETENPVTRQRETDLRAARFLIDTLAMLEEKTRGNRTSEEDEYLAGVLANLRMAFVRRSG